MSDNKLILIEGIPGSGKSTTAGAIKEYLEKMNIPSRLYLESDCNNPSDFAWVSVLGKEEYERLVLDYNRYEQAIRQYSEEFGGYTLVYYQAMHNNSGIQFPKEMMDFLGRHEPYDGKISMEEFFSLSLMRYKLFSEKASAAKELHVFESSYFQNQVNELLLFHDLDKNQVIEHLAKLAQCYEVLKPVIIYLSQEDVRKTISRVAAERSSPDKDKYPDWIDHVIGYISRSRYGMKHGLSGFDGAVEYFERRKEIELEAIEHIGLHSIIIVNNDYDVDTGIPRVIDAFSEFCHEED